MSETAYDIFHKVYNGQTNFMTPNVIRCGKRGGFLYELSSGRGISNEPIFGVTLINRLTHEKEHKLNALFQSQSEAEDYIRSLAP